MKSSVIIPTYNGAHKLPKILEALQKQTIAPDEIVIIVDGSVDNTKEVLENYLKDIPALRVLYQSNQGRGAVRNKGAKAAVGDILIFLDDDIRPERDNIERHIRFHRKSEKSILFGKVTLDPTKISNDDFSSFRSFVESRNFSNYKSGVIRITLENYAFTSANFSCRREVFLQLGGFDNGLKDSEDFDFSIRAIQQGREVYFDTGLISWHDDLVPIERYIKRQVEYVRSKQNLAVIKPEIVKAHPQSFNYGVTVKNVKNTVRSAFIYNRFWNKVLCNHFFLRYVPVSVRHKIYELVIHSSLLKEVKTSKHADEL